MRHRKKRVMQMNTRQKRSNVLRNLITSLVEHGQVKTTLQFSRALKAEADQFIGSLVKCYENYPTEADAKREIIRRIKPVIYTESAGKKLADDLVPAWNDAKQTFGFVRTVKLGARPGDNAEKVLVSLS